MTVTIECASAPKGEVVADEVLHQGRRPRNVTPEIVEAFRALLPELSPTSSPLTAGDLDEIVSFPANTALCRHAIRVAGDTGASVLDLTSAPSRKRMRNFVQ